MKKELEQMVTEWLLSLEFLHYGANYYADWLIFGCGAVVAYFLFFGIYRLTIFIVEKILRKKKAGFHHSLLKKKLYRRVFYIPTMIVINALTKLLFGGSPETVSFLQSALSICSVLVTCSILFSILNAFDDSFSKKQVSIKSIVQSAKTVIYIIVAIFIICLLLSVEIEKLLAGLAGASAIMMLVFKDSILGLVAGIQLSINKMVMPGDWIEMASSDADGTVIEISQITVKVQNWDNTITTIPAYDMISKPVKNWRGMWSSGMRRIKRSVFIDMTSVQFCTKEMLDKFRKIQYLDEYISKKETEITEHNNALAFDKEIEVNGRHLTNLGIFRAYLQRYLEHHPGLNHESMIMARQLQPTNLGIPIEIYGFAKTINWKEYEKIQSDIFDYILSSINYFELRIFQTPSWNDYRKR